MSVADFTNRVYLPNGNKIYVTDDVWGDQVKVELYKEYGDLKVEGCRKEQQFGGKSLDELEVVCTYTLLSENCGEDAYGYKGFVIAHGLCEEHPDNWLVKDFRTYSEKKIIPHICTTTVGKAKKQINELIKQGK